MRRLFQNQQIIRHVTIPDVFLNERAKGITSWENGERRMSDLVGFHCGGAAVNDPSSGQKLKAAEVLG